MNLVNFTSIDSFFKPKYRKDIYMHELFKYFFLFFRKLRSCNSKWMKVDWHMCYKIWKTLKIRLCNIVNNKLYTLLQKYVETYTHFLELMVHICI